MMADMRAGVFDRLTVVRIDRLHRGVRDLLATVEEFRAAGRTVRYLDLPEIAGPMGDFVLTILGAAARLESDLISSRTKAGMDEAKRRGLPLAKPPVGFDWVEATGDYAPKPWVLEFRDVAAKVGVPEATRTFDFPPHNVGARRRRGQRGTGRLGRASGPGSYSRVSAYTILRRVKTWEAGKLRVNATSCKSGGLVRLRT